MSCEYLESLKHPSKKGKKKSLKHVINEKFSHNTIYCFNISRYKLKILVSKVAYMYYF